MTLNIYLIPGMSAGRESFEALTLPDHCSATVIPWLLPKRKEPLIQQRGTQAKRQADGEHDVGELLECMQPLGSSDLQRQGSPNQ